MLEDVVIPHGPAAPARCSEDEWLAEAATLDARYERAFGTLLAERSKRGLDLAEMTGGRHAGLTDVKRLTRHGHSIAEAAELLDMTPHQAAGILGASPHRAEQVLAVEDYLRRHKDHSYNAVARATGVAVGTVIRYAELLGLKREVKGGAPRPLSDEKREKARVLVLEDVAAGRRPRWSCIGREVGLDRGSVLKLARREGWV